MRTAAYNVGVASDRRRRKNVQSTFFVLCMATKKRRAPIFDTLLSYYLFSICLFLKEIRNLDGLFFHLTGRCSRLLHGRDGSTLRSLRNIRLDSSLRICRMCNMGRIQTCCWGSCCRTCRRNHISWRKNGSHLLLSFQSCFQLGSTSPYVMKSCCDYSDSCLICAAVIIHYGGVLFAWGIAPQVNAFYYTSMTAGFQPVFSYF